MNEPKNGDILWHQSQGLVEVIKPWGDTSKTHEHVCEIIAFRPAKERRILSHHLMEPFARRDVAKRVMVCGGCEKSIPAGNDYFRMESPANESGPELVGDLCGGCVQEICHLIPQRRRRTA